MGSSRTGPSTGRARRALAAMRALGFPKKLILAVLKRLLKDFDRGWELIEDENYRVLADAILDAQANGNGHQEQEPEQEEIDDIPAGYGDPFTSLAGGPPSPPSPTAERYAATTELAISPRQQARASTRTLSKRRHRQMMDAVLQEDDAVFLREPKPEPVDEDASACRDVQPGLIGRSRRHTDSEEEMFRVLPPRQPDRNLEQIPGARNRTIRHCINREMTTLPVESTRSTLNSGMEPVVQNVQEAPCLDIGSASSSMGEVKLSLKCSVDPSKFGMPALEAVFKMVEDKCLHSHKVPPNFSFGSLMTEICQCVVQLGTEHTVDHNMQSDGVGNGSRSEDGINRKQKAAEELLGSNGSERGPVNSTLAQQQHLAPPVRRTNHDVTDISKGEERVRISILDESGRLKCPPSFYYIPRNLVFQNALVDMSLAKIGGEDCCADCFGNCLSSPEPCACARETGGEYAYTQEGLVRPAFIDECVSMNRFPEKHQKVFCETCPFERSRNKGSPEPCRATFLGNLSRSAGANVAVT